MRKMAIDHCNHRLALRSWDLVGVGGRRVTSNSDETCPAASASAISHSHCVQNWRPTDCFLLEDMRRRKNVLGKGGRRVYEVAPSKRVDSCHFVVKGLGVALLRGVAKLVSRIRLFYRKPLLVSCGQESRLQSLEPAIGRVWPLMVKGPPSAT